MTSGHNVPNYIEHGGARNVIGSGGSLDVESGGEMDIESGADLKLDGTTVDASAAEINQLDTGAMTLKSITGGDSSLGIDGMAGSTGNGGAVPIAGGIGDAGDGGAVSLTGGLGDGTGDGGAAAVAGGAGGTTGAGGLASLTGGAGDGGGGGVSGAATVDAGAVAGGTGADVNVGVTNAVNVNIGGGAQGIVLNGVALTATSAQMNTLLRDPGRLAINVLQVALDVADVETVTIGADVYEFDRAVDGVVGGNIAVTAHANDTPAAATDALIDAINASGTEAVTAYDISVNEILIVADAVGAVTLGCTETMGGAANEWAAANMYGGAAAAMRTMCVQTRVPTAQDVTMGNMHFAFDFTPTVVIVQARITATGIDKLWAGGYSLANDVVTVDNTGGTDWAVTDDITVIAFA